MKNHDEDPLSGRFEGRHLVTAAEAKEIFSILSSAHELVWEVSADGCWARAHEMSRQIVGSGLPCGKVFAMSGGRLRIGIGEMKTPKRPKVGPWVSWPMHVAPCIEVATDNGVVVLVLDPAVLDEPEPINAWLAKMGDADAKVSLQPWMNYKPKGYFLGTNGKLEFSAFERDDEFRSAFDELVELSKRRLGGLNDNRPSTGK